MFNKKLYLIILVLAVGLSACSGVVASAAQTETENNVAQAQAAAPVDQLIQSKGPGGEGNPQGKDGQRRPQIDFAAAAEELGVSEETLQTALRESAAGQGKPDFAAVAETLGVTEEELVAALGIPAGRADGEQGRQRPQIDFAAAAEELGVSEETLQTALRESAAGQGKPDFAAVAETLGVTEEALKDALGIPANAPFQNAPQDAPTSAQG